MTAGTVAGIISIVIAFALFSGAFFATMRGKKRLAIGLGVTAFLFMTLIPVSLALFVAVPNPT
ncbi:hypothetical protein [Corynebacterium sp. Marseille-P4321]|uniref:hypothetical protein n=1 Tax=Corynebacterium sp. Marseille-P4321 TaxID=2736603 RepID=UPI000892BD76|nr:hypothetical protein [Corynebacterium sp. Marseille-P4321]OEY04761.1 hypothetical protein A0K93_06530 [Corynebacterium sp. BCW_4722]